MKENRNVATRCEATCRGEWAQHVKGWIQTRAFWLQINVKSIKRSYMRRMWRQRQRQPAPAHRARAVISTLWALQHRGTPRPGSQPTPADWWRPGPTTALQLAAIFDSDHSSAARVETWKADIVHLSVTTRSTEYKTLLLVIFYH